MRGRIIGAALAIGISLSTNTLDAQRPRLGIGIGGGVVLGSQLAEQGFASGVGGDELQLIQQVDLDQVVIGSGRVEWYAFPHLALRAHGAWGVGRLQITTFADHGGVWEPGIAEGSFGDVRVRALDAGLSFWPWAPRTVGFAPFVTLGVGSFDYSFEDLNGDTSFFQARGTRSGQAFLLGLGADMHVWRSVMLRMEAVNHRVDSPLRAGDFTYAAPNGLNDRVSNIRLTVAAQMYFPFGTVETEP